VVLAAKHAFVAQRSVISRNLPLVPAVAPRVKRTCMECLRVAICQREDNTYLYTNACVVIMCLFHAICTWQDNPMLMHADLWWLIHQKVCWCAPLFIFSLTHNHEYLHALKCNKKCRPKACHKFSIFHGYFFTDTHVSRFHKLECRYKYLEK
jgi:hypothetical protein